MKKADDPRHVRRINFVQKLFEISFKNNNENLNYADLKDIITKIPDIDPLIEKAAPQFPVLKIAKIDVAILRLAVYELEYEKREPVKVIIDEAVEIAKQFGGEGSPSFINGVLGNIIKNRTQR